MFTELGDAVPRWVTHNEPRVTAFHGHAYGDKAPGRRDWRESFVVAHHVLLSHGLAVRAFRAAGIDASIGITIDMSPCYGDDWAVHRWDEFRNRWFADAIFHGRYPRDLHTDLGLELGVPSDFAVITEPIDFLGVNYYTRSVVDENPNDGPIGVRELAPVLPVTHMGWEVYPEGLYELLIRVERDYGDIPILITENGSAYDDPQPTNGLVEDPGRLAYLRDHLAAVSRAIADGVQVEGYYAWSLLDNFEWEHGYDKRFGIVYVDYETQRRTPKQSALWYRDLIADAKS